MGNPQGLEFFRNSILQKCMMALLNSCEHWQDDGLQTTIKRSKRDVADKLHGGIESPVEDAAKSPDEIEHYPFIRVSKKTPYALGVNSSVLDDEACLKFCGGVSKEDSQSRNCFLANSIDGYAPPDGPFEENIHPRNGDRFSKRDYACFKPHDEFLTENDVFSKSEEAPIEPHEGALKENLRSEEASFKPIDLPTGCTSHSASTSSGFAKHIHNDVEGRKYHPQRNLKVFPVRRDFPPGWNTSPSTSTNGGSSKQICNDVKGRKYPPPRNLRRFPVRRDFPPGCTSHSASTSSRNGVNVASEDKRNGCSEMVVASQQSGVGIDMIKVTLKRYWELLAKIKEFRVGSGSKKNAYFAAAMTLQNQQQCVNTTRRQGPVSGVEVGDMFHCRAELFVIGLHRRLQKGIDSMQIEGHPVAISVVATSRYDNDMRFPGVLIYSGEGGNPRVENKKPVDQKLTGGNLALKNSIGFRNPVRVIRCYDLSKPFMPGLRRVFVYDGLYYVDECSQERGEFGKLVFKFTLIKYSGQPELALDALKLQSSIKDKLFVTSNAGL